MSGSFSRTLPRRVFRVLPRRPCLSISRYSTPESRIFSYVPCLPMSTSNFKYGYIEDVETLEDYRPGGYHPIQIDDRLHKRYRIVHKLGHGAFSTAWLALDEQTSKYVAIKVGTADADRREVDILSQLTTGVAACSHAADKASMIPMAVDRFSLDGPNGTHPCFVTVPARCSLMDAKEASGPRLLQLDVARSLAAQLVMAVSLVHSQGYAHGVEQLYAKFGAPEPEPVLRLDGKPTSLASGVPSHVIPPVWLGVASDEIALNEAKLLLSDFGVAFRPSDRSRFESYTPLVIRPPEALFEPTTPLSFASDIWSLGCTIFELLAHRSLIDGILAPQDEITAQQVHLQGSLPSEWWDKWEQRFKWFDDAGRPLSKERDIWRWDRRFDQWIQELRQSCGMGVINEEERAALLELLHWMLAWRPRERPNAEEVLDTAWMKRWALPAYEESRKA
ncbi:Serine/threonine-protein kinase SRPK [Tolypocladium ophioglossoides CBS 100239]|uniref:non-specific serine/threonine protein kinase n=1 Tax=Tolypocladium ophioglossoides (strain CBS 100239) TaxID=1163406 RepID=A0A0L0NHC3_TOLOC|nr:Serine/threonine-protein kinase SRPK [Tolypocladium ophioglossoides CBS 100239]